MITKKVIIMNKKLELIFNHSCTSPTKFHHYLS